VAGRSEGVGAPKYGLHTPFHSTSNFEHELTLQWAQWPTSESPTLLALCHCDCLAQLYVTHLLKTPLEVQPQTASNANPRFVSSVTGSSHGQHEHASISNNCQFIHSLVSCLSRHSFDPESKSFLPHFYGLYAPPFPSDFSPRRLSSQGKELPARTRSCCPPGSERT
jgi:hypothetical protein